MITINGTNLRNAEVRRFGHATFVTVVLETPKGDIQIDMNDTDLDMLADAIDYARTKKGRHG